MPWLAITADDLNATKLAPLVNALRTAALAGGQADPLIEITANVVSRIRRMIAGCRTNLVDADATLIPASLKALACRMIIREAKDRLEIDLTNTETEAWRVDERDLVRISTCDLPIEIAYNSEAPPVQSTQPGPSITAREKRYGRDQQSGA
jgi:hypothetical protein